MLRIGTKTRYGKIGAIMMIEKERYYFMVDKDRCVTMMPAVVMEKYERRIKELREAGG